MCITEVEWDKKNTQESQEVGYWEEWLFNHRESVLLRNYNPSCEAD